MDLFISHGGANSMLESVFQVCPLITFPLNNISDQRGNSTRIEYFNFGKKLNLNISIDQLKTEIDKIFFEYDFLNLTY